MMRKLGKVALTVNGVALVGYGLAELDRSIHNPHEMPNDSPYVVAFGTTATGTISDVPYVTLPNTITGDEYALPASERKARMGMRRGYRGVWTWKA